MSHCNDMACIYKVVYSARKSPEAMTYSNPSLTFYMPVLFALYLRFQPINATCYGIKTQQCQIELLQKNGKLELPAKEIVPFKLLLERDVAQCFKFPKTWAN